MSEDELTTEIVALVSNQPYLEFLKSLTPQTDAIVNGEAPNMDDVWVDSCRILQNQNQELQPGATRKL